MPSPGDEVVTKSPLWHHGTDVGDRLGRIISASGHIVVEIYDYDDNPVKCFRHEVEVIAKTASPAPSEGFLEDYELTKLLDNIFPVP